MQDAGLASELGFPSSNWPKQGTFGKGHCMATSLTSLAACKPLFKS